MRALRRLRLAICPLAMCPLAMCPLALVLLAGCAFGAAIPASAIPTATHDDLRLATDHASYGVHTPIGVTLVNVGPSDYYGVDGHSACTLVQVQQYDFDQKQWLAVDGCTPSGQPRALLIPAGAREPFTLAPTSAADANAWQPGLYRLAATYSANGDGVTSARTAYSAGYEVQ